MYMAVSSAGGIAKSIGQLVVLILIFAFILLLAYWTSKITAKIQYKTMKNGNVEIIETVRLQNNKYLQIVKVADKYLVLGLGKEEVNFLTEISGEEVIRRGTAIEDGKTFADFSSVFSKVMKAESENGQKVESDYNEEKKTEA